MTPLGLGLWLFSPPVYSAVYSPLVSAFLLIHWHRLCLMSCLSLREEDGAVAFKNFAPMFCLAIPVIPVLVNSDMAQSFAEGRRSQEKIPILCESELF